jgi:UDP-N-acetylmuramyl-tripeptide synthetase
MGKDIYTVKDYFELLNGYGLVEFFILNEKDLAVQIEDLSYDSKNIDSGGLFICKGSRFKKDYLHEAADSGAVCFVSEKDYLNEDAEFPRIIVSDIRKTMAVLSNLFYGEAQKELKLIGITGTKGKSTTTYYIKYILDHFLGRQNKPKSAIISGIDVEDGVLSFEAHLTTPEAPILHKHFRNAVDSGIEYLEMEVSSQALKFHRTFGVTYDVACFLNIEEDHISPIEHSDFDDYLDAKLLLMKQCKIACINIEANHSSEACDIAAQHAEKIVTFGLDERADIYAHRIVKEEDDIRFTVKAPLFEHEFRLSMPGLFNVENALAAIAACHSLNIPLESIFQGLWKARVPGRMETYWGKRSGTLVIVDYAHNRLSFDRLFTSTIREFPDRRITAVFGCPGSKALARRRELAEIAGRYAKKILITEEDPGEESVQEISKEIARHAAKTGCPYEIINDRESAIKKAIYDADEKTVILLTGKGRETRQKRGTKYVDCPSDVDYVLKYLK